jgi:hypothetical protein
MAKTRHPDPGYQTASENETFRMLCRYYVTASKIGAWRLVIWNSLS